MRTIPALAFALFLLSGCASPIALRLDETGTPVIQNTSGRELHEVEVRIVSVRLDGRTALDDISIATWLVDDWRQAPGAKMNAIAGMEARGESREVKKFHVRWTAPYLP